MRAIIFDFDGTLGDSLAVVIEIAHTITNRPQLVLPEEVERMRTLRLLDVAKELRIPKWRWPYLLFRGRALMSARLAEVLPFPGIEEVIRALHEDGYQLYIMSSNSAKTIERFLLEHGMSSYFTKVYGGVGLLSKANSMRRILKKNNLVPDETIYVGDEPRDIDASKLIGIPCVAVAWGYNTADLLAEHAPMVVVRTTAQLQKVLEQWGGEI